MSIRNEGYTSVPNDTVVIIGRKIPNNSNSFIIEPLEVALGRIDEKTNIFECENNIASFNSVTSYSASEDEELYCLPRKLSELQGIYGEELSSTSLMILYFRDVIQTKLLGKTTNDGVELHAVPNTEIETRSDDAIKEVHNIASYTSEVSSNGKAKPIVKTKHSFAGEKIDPLKDGIDLEELIKYVTDRIVGNEETIRNICTTIAVNLRTKNPMRNRRLLSIGPTGSGKSQTFKTISEYINLPVQFVDCNELSAAGYVGKSVEDFLRDMYSKAGGKVDLANRGVLILDEIDKLAASSSLEMKEAAQDSLLKVVEGAEFNIEVNRQLGSRAVLDTRTMTVVGAGAFSSIFENRKKENKHNPIGFSTKKEGPEVVQTESGIIYPVTDEELTKFGFKKEFIPRFTVRNTYAEINEEGYRKMLLESQISPLLLLIEDFAEEYDCEVVYDDELIDAIIAKAIELDQGGRSLTKLVQDSTLRAEEEIYKLKTQDERDGVVKERKLKLSKDILTDKSKFDIM